MQCLQDNTDTMHGAGQQSLSAPRAGMTPCQQGHQQCNHTANTKLAVPENPSLLSVRGMGENRLCCGRAVSILYLLSAAPGPSGSCPGLSVPQPDCCAQSGSWEQPAARADGTVQPQSNIVQVTHCAAAAPPTNSPHIAAQGCASLAQPATPAVRARELPYPTKAACGDTHTSHPAYVHASRTPPVGAGQGSLTASASL